MSEINKLCEVKTIIANLKNKWIWNTSLENIVKSYIKRKKVKEI